MLRKKMKRKPINLHSLKSKAKGSNVFVTANFVFSEYRVIPYIGNVVEVTRSSDNATQEFTFVDGSLNSYIDSVAIVAFVGAGNNGYYTGMYDLKTGVKTTIPQAQAIQCVNAGVWVARTAKYVLEIPQYTSLTVSGIAACNRMNHKSLCTYAGYYGPKSISGYTNDYVFPAKCGIGIMDFALFNVVDIFWYDADGNTSILNRPGVNLANAGISYVFSTDMLNSTVQLIGYNTKTNYQGSLKDIPRLTYWLGLSGCSNLTGDLKDLGGRLTYALTLEGCTSVTGTLSDLQGKITYLLGLSGCSLITGDLSDLQGKITYYLTMNGMSSVTGDLASLNGAITYMLSLTSCSLLKGVYTPVGDGTPTIFVVSSTDMDAMDIDATLAACHTAAKSDVTFTAANMYRTAASNEDYTSLDIDHGWTFNNLALVNDDIDTYTSNAISLNVKTQESSGRAIYVHPKGTKMYLLGTENDTVIQYNLATAYNISTGSYVGSFSVAGQLVASSYSLFFKSDGTAMYVGGSSTDDVCQYSLSTAWDITTATYVQNFSVADKSTSQRKIVFSDNGVYMYVLNTGKDLHQYTLGTAWDVSTAVFTSTLDLGLIEAAEAFSVALNRGGTKLYASGSDCIVHQYNLGTPWDISTAADAAKSIDMSGIDGVIWGYTFSGDMKYMYGIGSGNDKIYELT